MRVTWSVSMAKLRIIYYLSDGEIRPPSQIKKACRIRLLTYLIAMSHLVSLGIVEKWHYQGLGPPSTSYYMTPEWIDKSRQIVLNVKNST